MAWLVIHAILMSVFVGGLSGQVQPLRPAAVKLSFPNPIPTAQAAEMTGPRKIVPESLGVELKAPSAALVDTESGQVLFSKGRDRIVPIASITKLMTALVALEHVQDWDAKVTIAAGDHAFEGLPYLKTGETLTVRDAFDTALIGSVNAAAVALSRSTGMTREQFVGRMNSKAKELGMAYTRFVDPTGYGPGNVSTVLDVARLAHVALERPEIREALAKKEFVLRFASGSERRVPATNILLGSFLNEGEYRLVGGKTGYTEEAGYTLVLRATEGTGDVIGVVLGSPTSEDRFQDVKSLLAWGFRTFQW